MNLRFSIALVLAGGLALAPQSFAQSSSTDEAQKPAAEATPPGASANPFPEDTNTVPVMPAVVTPAGNTDEEESGSGSVSLPMASKDVDPIRSPDDPAADADSVQEENASSSLKNLEDLLPKPDSDKPDKKKKLTIKEPTRKESAAKDVEVGEFYLGRKQWKAALSRYQSALVLDPENPEVYWGMAESERHLGLLADARAHYLQLLDYDPDGPHSKQARKALLDPSVANGKNAELQPTQAFPVATEK